MARGPAGNEPSELGSGIAARAGLFLEINFVGGSKDKRIARELGISPGMAKMLRAGRGWTVARVDQVMQRWPEFRDFVFPRAEPATGAELAARLDQLAQGFERLAAEIGAFRAELQASNATLRAEFEIGLGALRQDLQALRR
jgi:hypothetical protein